MAFKIIRTETPEERELVAKKADLAVLETQLAQRELDLATLHGELHAFEQRYLRIVGVKFAEIDQLEAEIAEALSRRSPSDGAARQQAAGARAKATESAQATSALVLADSVEFKPSDDLRSLFREIAKRIHPDLATDDTDRAKRTRMMGEANVAYRAGDEARLRAILNEWETSPDAVTGEGIGAELIRIIRKIHQVQERLAKMEQELIALTEAELSVLNVKAESERQHGRDLLTHMADQLDERIAQLRQESKTLRSSEAPS